MIRLIRCVWHLPRWSLFPTPFGVGGRAGRPPARAVLRRLPQRGSTEIPAAARGLRCGDLRSAGARRHQVRPASAHCGLLRRVVGLRCAEAGDRLDPDRRAGGGPQIRRSAAGAAPLVRRPYFDQRRHRVRGRPTGARAVRRGTPYYRRLRRRHQQCRPRRESSPATRWSPRASSSMAW